MPRPTVEVWQDECRFHSTAEERLDYLTGDSDV